MVVELRVRRALSRVPQERVDASRVANVVIGALELRARPLIFEPLLFQFVVSDDCKLLVFFRPRYRETP